VFVNAEKSNKKKRKKKETMEAITALGRLFAIKELASIANASIFPPRFLTKNQTEPLYKVDKLAAESAINAWEHYFIRPSEFILDMYETITLIRSMKVPALVNSSGTENINTFGDNYIELVSLDKEILNGPWKFEAERVKRIKNSILPPFYFAAIVMFFAILLGIWGISGVKNGETAKDLLNPYTLSWLVGLPVGLSSFGFYFSIVGIFNSTR
jgi:hypothetical protein